MFDINNSDQEYKEWLKHRNKKKLIIRTLKKKKRKLRDSRVIEKNHNTNRLLKQEYIDKEVSFVAPSCFSFINNLKETIDFFNGLVHFITNKSNFGKRVYIDLSQIVDYTTDALMYLIAMLNNLNEHFKGKYRFWGSVPMDPKVERKFKSSGFFKYVHYIGEPNSYSQTENTTIISGNNSNPLVCKQVSDFVSKKANVSIFECRYIYIMLIEMMSNTSKHAYNEKTILTPQWYCFVEYNEGIITFTFMDTGAGIPSTVRKNFSEKIDILKIKGDDKYVMSALNGDFRTSTSKIYRGKGLPKIKEICSKEQILNMRIITSKADVELKKSSYNSSLLSNSFVGTLYNWQIQISDLKGGYDNGDKCSN